jgi:hypothetical protein
MIKVRQDEGGNLMQVEAQCATVLWDSFGKGAWQLTVTVWGDQEHKIVLRMQGERYTGPIILEGKNFEVEYTPHHKDESPSEVMERLRLERGIRSGSVSGKDCDVENKG